MKIILLKNVSKLGQAGDLKEVSTGYARNFLFPQKLARLATDKALAQAKDIKKSGEKKIVKKVKNIKGQAKKLDGLKVEVSVKVSKGGKLFGALTAQNICDIIKEKGFEISKNQIVIDKPIKELGQYEVKVDWGGRIESKISVKVIDLKAI